MVNEMLLFMVAGLGLFFVRVQVYHWFLWLWCWLVVYATAISMISVVSQSVLV